jgi:hypothetical protein
MLDERQQGINDVAAARLGWMHPSGEPDIRVGFRKVSRGRGILRIDRHGHHAINARRSGLIEHGLDAATVPVAREVAVGVKHGACQTWGLSNMGQPVS